MNQYVNTRRFLSPSWTCLCLLCLSQPIATNTNNINIKKPHIIILNIYLNRKICAPGGIHTAVLGESLIDLVVLADIRIKLHICFSVALLCNNNT